MEEEVVGRPKDWLEEVGYKTPDSTSRKYQTTARFSQEVFDYLQERAAENGNSLAEEIRKAVRNGLQEAEGGV